MAYLGKYIRQMLSKQEPVTLPGFGSLVISQSSGSKAQDGKMDPPGVMIRFDAEHPRDDGKLAAEYAAGEQMDAEEARQQVLELVDAIKFKLDKGEDFALDLVGTFSRDADNRVHFVKDENWIIDPDLFGLPTLDLLDIEEEKTESSFELDTEADPKVETKAESTSETKPAEKTSVGTVQKEAPPMKKKMANRAPVNKWRIIWIIVGALIVVLVLILLIPVNNGDNGIEFGKQGIVFRSNTVDDDLSDAEESNELVTDGEQEVSPDFIGTSEAGGDSDEEVSGEDEESSTADPVTTEHNFFIIAGSFAEIQNATELMESLKADGFPAEIIRTESRLYRVSVKSYATKQAALDELGRIQQHPGLGACWVWSR